MCEITRFARHQTSCSRTLSHAQSGFPIQTLNGSIRLRKVRVIHSSRNLPARWSAALKTRSSTGLNARSRPAGSSSTSPCSIPAPVRSLKIPGTQHFHRGLVDPRSGTAGTILRRDDHPGFCFAATRSDRPAIDQETAHSSPPASARSRAARRSMLPEVPQTRRRPAVQKEPSLKSDTQHTGVLHSCLVASRVCGADRPVPPSVV